MAENIDLALLYHNTPSGERKKRGAEVMDRMGIAHRAKHMPSQLSGGQQQRVAVARALSTRPKFILADEPTANLDSAATDNLLDMMLKMNAKEQTTFIFSSHDDRVMKRAKRLIKLNDGKVEDDAWA